MRGPPRWGLLGICLAAAMTGRPAERPNVLVVFTDDHGWADLGVHGVNGEIRTPNLDRLAADGVVCTRGYVTAPQCTPSRAGLLTGQYQQRWGVEQNGSRLPLEAVTIAERLRKAGYATGMSGKWHLEVERRKEAGAERDRVSVDHLPHAQGFEEYFCGARYDYVASHALDGTPLPGAPQKLRVAQQCRVVTQTEAALGFLRRRAADDPRRPWFLYVAYVAPHVPLESPEPWFSTTPTHVPQQRRQALALIAAMDEGVGRLREQIRAMGQETNTLVVFISDNGAPLGRAWDGSLNAPMRGQKGMLSEGGIRVPFLVAWPGRIPAGQQYEHPVSSLDIAATAVAAAGLPTPPELDGVDLVPFFTGTTEGPPHPALFWRWRSQAAVLEFPWKFVVLGDRERFLFDVTTPEGEAHERNLIQQHLEIAARLEAKLKAWSEALQPPGLLTSVDAVHERLFVEHGILAATNATAQRPAMRSLEWIARNGTVIITHGAVRVVPSDGAAQRVFLAHSGLDLIAPVQVTIVARARRGGRGAIAWRMEQEAEFAPANMIAFDWPAGDEWTTIALELPARGRVVQVRLVWPRGGEDVELRSIELQPAQGEARRWRFDS